jgi:hypothetical protein
MGKFKVIGNNSAFDREFELTLVDNFDLKFEGCPNKHFFNMLGRASYNHRNVIDVGTVIKVIYIGWIWGTGVGYGRLE